MIKKDLLIIINPVSGKKKAPQLCNKIYQQLDKSKFNIFITFTGGPGEGSLLAQRAIQQKFDYVIAVGGDGTVNEIAKELVHTDVCMGILPNGSGNGLAFHLGISENVNQAIDIINQENCVKIDYCTANDIKFFCTFGMGFDALISYSFSQSTNRGFATYIEKVLKEYINYQPEEYIISCEGKDIQSKAFLITCANASQWGNNVFIAPNASVTDGYIDVMTMEPFNIINAAPLAFHLLTKKIDQRHNIKMYRAKEFTFQRKEKGIYHFDGEPIEMGNKVTIKNIPKALNMLVPKNRKI